jgi:osmotically-inducible protein OsmY
VVAIFFGLSTISLAGCNRQDTESLARIGRKIATHSKTNTDELSAKLDLRKAVKKDPSLQEKIQDRLRWDTVLASLTFEVQVKEKEVELVGTVQTPQQRQRAIELTETVVGVEKVIDAIQVREATDK